MVAGNEFSNEELFRLLDGGQAAGPPTGMAFPDNTPTNVLFQQLDATDERRPWYTEIPSRFGAGVARTAANTGAWLLQANQWPGMEPPKVQLRGKVAQDLGVDQGSLLTGAEAWGRTLDPERFESLRRKGTYTKMDPMWWIGGVAETIPFMAGAMAAGAVGGPAGAFVFSMAAEGGGAYLDAKTRGASETEAQITASVVGLVNGALETLPVNRVLKRAKGVLGQAGSATVKKVAQRAAARVAKRVTVGTIASEIGKQAIWEGVTEALQEIVGMVAAEAGYGADFGWQEYLQGATDAGLLGGAAGGLLGGGVETIVGIAGRPDPRQRALAQAKSASRADVAEAMGVKPAELPEDLRTKGQREAAVAEAKAAPAAEVPAALPSTWTEERVQELVEDLGDDYADKAGRKWSLTEYMAYIRTEAAKRGAPAEMVEHEFSKGGEEESAIEEAEQQVAAKYKSPLLSFFVQNYASERQLTDRAYLRLLDAMWRGDEHVRELVNQLLARAKSTDQTAAAFDALDDIAREAGFQEGEEAPARRLRFGKMAEEQAPPTERKVTPKDRQYYERLVTRGTRWMRNIERMNEVAGGTEDDVESFLKTKATREAGEIGAGQPRYVYEQTEGYADWESYRSARGMVLEGQEGLRRLGPEVPAAPAVQAQAVEGPPAPATVELPEVTTPDALLDLFYKVLPDASENDVPALLSQITRSAASLGLTDSIMHRATTGLVSDPTSFRWNLLAAITNSLTLDEGLYPFRFRYWRQFLRFAKRGDSIEGLGERIMLKEPLAGYKAWLAQAARMVESLTDRTDAVPDFAYAEIGEEGGRAAAPEVAPAQPAQAAEAAPEVAEAAEAIPRAGQPVVPPQARAQAAKIEERIAKQEAELARLAEEIQAEQPPGAARQTLEELKAKLMAAARDTGLPNTVIEETYKRKPVEVIAQAAKKGASKIVRALRRQALDAQKVMRQIKKRALAEAEPVATPTLDYMKAEGLKVKYGPKINYWAELSEWLPEQPTEVTSRFSKTKGVPLDEMAADMTNRPVDFAGDEDALLARLEAEGRAKAGEVRDVVGILAEQAGREEQELARLEGAIPEGWEAEADKTRTQYEAADRSYNEALEQLRQAELDEAVRKGLPAIGEHIEALATELDELSGLEAQATELQKTALKEIHAKIAKQLAAEQKKMASVVSGASRLRKQIVLAAKARNWSDAKRRAFSKKAIGTSRISQVDDTDKLSRLLTAIRAEPKGPKITPAAMAEAKAMRMTQQVAEFSEAGDAELQDILRARVTGTGKDGTITKENMQEVFESKARAAMRKRTAETSKGLLEELGGVPEGPRGGYNAPSGLLNLFKRGLSMFHLASLHIDNILKRLGDLHYRTIALPVHKVVQALNVAENERYLEAEGKLDEFGLTADSVYGVREINSKWGPQLGVNCIRVYMASKDEGALKHFLLNNKGTEKDVQDFIAAMTPGEKQLADWLLSKYQEYEPLVRAAWEEQTDTVMGHIDWYAPIFVKGQREADLGAWFADERIGRKMVEHGIVEHRTGPGMELNLDALEDYFRYVHIAERLIHVNPVVMEIRPILASADWRAAVEKNLGEDAHQVIFQWFEQATQLVPRDLFRWGSGLLRTLRRNAATAMIGLNVPSAGRAALSFFTSIGWRGKVQQNLAFHINSLATLAVSEKEMRAFVYERAPWIQYRHAERELQERAQQLRRSLPHGWRRTHARLVKAGNAAYGFVDKHTVIASWFAHYNRFISETTELDGDALEQAAIEEADMAVRHTQPMPEVKDLPAIQRANEAFKWFGMFQNQLNKNYNIVFEDIPQGLFVRKDMTPAEAAGMYISTIVVPGLVLSFLARGRLPRKWEWLQDAAGWHLGTFYGIGLMAHRIVQGYTALTPPPISFIQDAGNVWKKRSYAAKAEAMAAAAGKLMGIPTSQPHRTAKGVYDILAGNTRDPRRLIWSESAMRLPQYKSKEAWRLAVKHKLTTRQIEQVAALDPKWDGKIGVNEVKAAHRRRLGEAFRKAMGQELEPAGAR